MLVVVISRTCAVFTELCFFAEITELVVFVEESIERVKQKFDLLSNKNVKYDISGTMSTSIGFHGRTAHLTSMKL